MASLAILPTTMPAFLVTLGADGQTLAQDGTATFSALLSGIASARSGPEAATSLMVPVPSAFTSGGVFGGMLSGLTEPLSQSPTEGLSRSESDWSGIGAFGWSSTLTAIDPLAGRGCAVSASQTGTGADPASLVSSPPAVTPAVATSVAVDATAWSAPETAVATTPRAIGVGTAESVGSDAGTGQTTPADGSLMPSTDPGVDADTYAPSEADAVPAAPIAISSAPSPEDAPEATPSDAASGEDGDVLAADAAVDAVSVSPGAAVSTAEATWSTRPMRSADAGVQPVAYQEADDGDPTRAATTIPDASLAETTVKRATTQADDDGSDLVESSVTDEESDATDRDASQSLSSDADGLVASQTAFYWPLLGGWAVSMAPSLSTGGVSGGASDGLEAVSLAGSGAVPGDPVPQVLSPAPAQPGDGRPSAAENDGSGADAASAPMVSQSEGQGQPVSTPAPVLSGATPVAEEGAFGTSAVSAETPRTGEAATAAFAKVGIDTTTVTSDGQGAASYAASAFAAFTSFDAPSIQPSVAATMGSLIGSTETATPAGPEAPAFAPRSLDATPGNHSDGATVVTASSSGGAAVSADSSGSDGAAAPVAVAPSVKSPVNASGNALVSTSVATPMVAVNPAMNAPVTASPSSPVVEIVSMPAPAMAADGGDSESVTGPSPSGSTTATPVTAATPASATAAPAVIAPAADAVSMPISATPLSGPRGAEDADGAPASDPATNADAVIVAAGTKTAPASGAASASGFNGETVATTDDNADGAEAGEASSDASDGTAAQTVVGKRASSPASARGTGGTAPADGATASRSTLSNDTGSGQATGSQTTGAASGAAPSSTSAEATVSAGSSSVGSSVGDASVATSTASAATLAATDGATRTAAIRDRVVQAVAAQGMRTPSRFTVRLAPADLGAVEVDIVSSPGQTVTAHLSVDRSDTFQLLDADRPRLEQSLRDVGVRLQDGGLSISLRQDGAGGQGQGDQWAAQRQASWGRGYFEDTGTTTVTPEAAHTGALSYVRARRSMIDIVA